MMKYVSHFSFIGHNNGTITVWNFEENGEIGRNFQAHSASIFTLEINKVEFCLLNGIVNGIDELALILELETDSIGLC